MMSSLLYFVNGVEKRFRIWCARWRALMFGDERGPSSIVLCRIKVGPLKHALGRASSYRVSDGIVGSDRTDVLFPGS